MSKNSIKAADLLKNAKNAGLEAGAENALNAATETTENGTENADSKKQKFTAETPREFLLQKLSTSVGNPLATPNIPALTLTGMKANSDEFLNEFFKEFNANNAPATKAKPAGSEFALAERIRTELAAHARQEAAERHLKIQVINFLLKEIEITEKGEKGEKFTRKVCANFEKFIAPNNPAGDFIKAELKILKTYLKAGLENLLKFPKAVGNNEGDYAKTKKAKANAELKEKAENAEKALQDEKAKNAELLARIAELEKKAGQTA